MNKLIPFSLAALFVALSFFLLSATTVSSAEQTLVAEEFRPLPVEPAKVLPVEPKLEKKKKSFFKKQKHKDDDARPFHWANIVGLVTGVLGLIVVFLSGGGGLLLGLLGLIFGAIGMKRSGETKEYRGWGMGLTGLIAGILILVLFLLLILFLAALFGAAVGI